MTKKNEDGQEPIETAPTPADTGVGAMHALPLPAANDVPGSVPAWVSDPAAAYAEIQKLRDEAGRYRTRANQLEADLETAAFDAAERGQALDALKATVRQGEVRTAVLLEAARAGIADPSDALALADLSGVAVGEDGAVTGAKEAVEALAAAKPYLRSRYDPAVDPYPEYPRPSAPAINPTNPGGGPALRPADLRALSSEAIARMDPDELRAALSNR